MGSGLPYLKDLTHLHYLKNCAHIEIPKYVSYVQYVKNKIIHVHFKKSLKHSLQKLFENVKNDTTDSHICSQWLYM